MDQSNTIFILIVCISSNNTFRVPAEIFLISLFQNTPVRKILLPPSLFWSLHNFAGFIEGDVREGVGGGRKGREREEREGEGGGGGEGEGREGRLRLHNIRFTQLLDTTTGSPARLHEIRDA